MVSDAKIPRVGGEQASAGLSNRRPISRRTFVKRGAAIAGAATVMRPGWASAQATAAETAIVGGRVLSMDGSARGATAVAIAGGR